jgi:hypothetical protein
MEDLNEMNRKERRSGNVDSIQATQDRTQLCVLFNLRILMSMVIRIG